MQDRKPMDVSQNPINEHTNEVLKVQGQIPTWLSGTLLRNGPVQFSIDGKAIPHWFDGLALLHSFSFIEGNVIYSNKFLRTDAYNTVMKEGSVRFLGFANDPCKSIFTNLLTYFFPAKQYPLQNCNVNVAQYADQFVALTETPLPVSFDPHTLETLGVFDYQDRLLKERCFESAHPHHIKSETINYIVNFGLESTYDLYKMKDHTSARQLFARIPTKEPSYMHSFSVTNNFVVLTEYPFVVNPFELMLSGQGFIKNFKWKPEKGTTFIIINKDNGNVVGKYRIDPFFAFHHVNAYEIDHEIVLDIITYRDASIINALADHGLDHPETNEEKIKGIKLVRYTVSLVKGSISSKVLLELPIELPTKNDKLDGNYYNYAYLTDIRNPLSMDTTREIYKINVQNGHVLSWSCPGCLPGEAVFVESPDANKEDDGVVLSIILDQKKNDSFLVVLDAATMKEVARVDVGYPIPAGLHGKYYKRV